MWGVGRRRRRVEAGLHSIVGRHESCQRRYDERRGGSFPDGVTVMMSLIHFTHILKIQSHLNFWVLLSHFCWDHFFFQCHFLDFLLSWCWNSWMQIKRRSLWRVVKYFVLDVSSEIVRLCFVKRMKPSATCDFFFSHFPPRYLPFGRSPKCKLIMLNILCY